MGENVIIYNILGFLDICDGCTVRFSPAGNCLHFVSLLSAILLDEKLDFAKIQLFVLLFGRKLLAEMLTRDLAFFECEKTRRPDRSALECIKSIPYQIFCALIFQISFAYSEIVRSEENLPELQMLIQHFLAHARLSW